MTYDSRPETWEHIDLVRELLMGAVGSLLLRGHQHDKTKLKSPELEAFDEFTPKLRELEYGTPAYTAALEAMGPALQHHYAAYRHHPEHFENGIQDMTLLDVIEMVCDWVAASARTKNGSIEQSIEVNQVRFGYSDDLKQILLNTAERLQLTLIPDGPWNS